jgi:dTDP-4-dehydrorhamnose reductase
VKCLLLGANGQLGQTFIADRGLAARGELMAASRDGSVPAGVQGIAADLGDAAALTAVLDAVAPDIVVNAAAYTAVDKAETEETAATLVNGDAPGVLGRWAARHGALVVHYSTDYVFPGDASSPYPTDAATGPQGAYGRSKLAGEHALADSGARHLTLRTAWVYSTVGHNFLKTMLRLGADREELRVVADQRGTPTTTDIIVAGTLAALDKYLAAPDAFIGGTYHLTASGETTWHGFADAIFDEAVAEGVLVRRPAVLPIGTAEFPTPARRPAYSVLDNRSFAHAFDHALPDWRDGLRATIRALAAQ